MSVTVLYIKDSPSAVGSLWNSFVSTSFISFFLLWSSVSEMRDFGLSDMMAGGGGFKAMLLKWLKSDKKLRTLSKVLKLIYLTAGATDLPLDNSQVGTALDTKVVSVNVRSTISLLLKVEIVFPHQSAREEYYLLCVMCVITFLQCRILRYELILIYEGSLTCDNDFAGAFTH